MNIQEIISQLTPIFTEVLDVENLTLTPQIQADDIEEWDSLSHIQLIVAIEKHFNLKFTSLEIQGWKNVQDICSTILNKE
ncbi:MAG: acyl carrier protein [Salinivirgaceae bacterium]|nr:acyl carrier protein [Salinivirgaceae bacterium]